MARFWTLPAAGNTMAGLPATIERPMPQPTVSQFLPDDLADAVLIGRAWRNGPTPGPSVIAVRDGKVFDITASAPTTADLFDHADRLDIARTRRRADGHGRGPDACQHRRRGRRGGCDAARTVRRAGHQGVRRDLRGEPARARHRGARGRRCEQGAGNPRDHQSADRRGSVQDRAGLRRRDAAEGGTGAARCVVAIHGGGHRPRRRSVLEVAADVVGRIRRGRRAVPDFEVEQPRARDRACREQRAAKRSVRRSATT